MESIHRPLVLLLSLLVLSLALLCASPLFAIEGGVVSTNLGASGAVLSDDWIAYLAYETFTGEDLNDDGDTDDIVVHVRDLLTSERTNTGLATKHCFDFEECSESLSLSGDWVVFAASESAARKDLNMDGDTVDEVIHVHSLTSRQTMNLGLKGSIESNCGDWIVMRIAEEGEDLNGDGDTSDEVIHVHNLASGQTTNLGFVGRVAANSEDSIVIPVAEFSHGSDLNGDGDTEDAVIHVHNLASSQTTNLGLVGEVRANCGDWVVMRILEQFQGEDLNDDGDMEDAVIHVHNLRSGRTTNLRRAVFHPVDPLLTWKPFLSQEWLAFWVSEFAHGEDLNGDGDSEDVVIHLHELTTGATTNLGVAGIPGPISAEWFTFVVSEHGQGEDLNDDGDTRDKIAHVRCLTTGETRSLNLPVGVFECQRCDQWALVSGDWLLMEVSEGQQGEDLNDDGDTEDKVAHVHKLSTDETTNLGLAGGIVANSGAWVVISVSEQVDLNGDGDTRDRFVHAYDLSKGVATNLELAAYASDVSLSGTWLAIKAVEHMQGDLNGDGDTEDCFVHLADLTGLDDLQPSFRRGDCNDDGTVDISDAVFSLGSLFLGDGDPGCDDACDSNDDGAMDISDAIATLGVLFLGNGVIPLPGMTDCGVDPTDDQIDCKHASECP